MPTPKKPNRNEAAATLARTRWAGVSKRDRTQIMRRVIQARWAKRRAT